MAHGEDVKTTLRAAYIFDRLPLEAAAEKVGVPLGTARRWKGLAAAQGDDWDKARAAAGLTSAGTGLIAQMILTDFLSLHQATMEQLRSEVDTPAIVKAEAISRLTDAFHKTMSAVAKAAPDLGRYAVATELLQLLAIFVRDRFPQHGAAFAEVLEPFAAHVGDKYG